MTYRIFLATFAFVVLIFDFCVFSWTMRNLYRDQQELAVWRTQFKACQSFANRKMTEIAILYATNATLLWVAALRQDGLISEEEFDRLVEEMGFCNDA